MEVPLHLHEQTREQSRATAGSSLLLWPLGAVEQHGPHLAVGTDWLTVADLAEAAGRTARERVPITIAPPMPFGSSHHHLPFGGTMSLSTDTYYRAVRDLAESLVVAGYRRIFLLNGHGGNHELLQLVARDVALAHPVRIAAGSYWAIAWDALVAQGAHLPGRLPGHAGAFETSLMLARHPGLVQATRPHRADAAGGDPRGWQTPYRSECHGSWQAIDGYSDSPDRGSAETGRQWFDTVVACLVEALVAFHGEPLPDGPPAGR